MFQCDTWAWTEQQTTAEMVMIRHVYALKWHACWWHRKLKVSVLKKYKKLKPAVWLAAWDGQSVQSCLHGSQEITCGCNQGLIQQTNNYAAFVTLCSVLHRLVLFTSYENFQTVHCSHSIALLGDSLKKKIKLHVVAIAKAAINASRQNTPFQLIKYLLEVKF